MAVKTVRAPMPRSKRAKIFQPFDALIGLREAIAAKERVIEPKRYLSDDAIAEINDTLLSVHAALPASGPGPPCWQDGAHSPGEGGRQQPHRADPPGAPFCSFLPCLWEEEADRHSAPGPAGGIAECEPAPCLPSRSDAAVGSEHRSVTVTEA